MLKFVNEIINKNKRKYKKYADYMKHGPVKAYIDLFDKKPKTGCFYTDDYVIWLENCLLDLVRKNIEIKKIIGDEVKDV